MVIGRAARRLVRTPQVTAMFGERQAAVVLDLLELTEYAWHDCYGEVTPPDEVIDDILIVSRGELARLVQAAKLAVVDSRDLRLAADDLRTNDK